MKTVELSTGVPDFGVMSSNYKILGYDPGSNKYGWVPTSYIINEGFACRRWNINNASPVGEAVGNIDALRNLPKNIGLGCYLVDNNHGRRKLSPTDHNKFATGDTAALDGSMGHYMQGWGTEMYIAFWREGDYSYQAIGLSPIPGRLNYRIPVASISAIGSSVLDNTDMRLVSYVNSDARYRGGNNDATKDGTFASLLGKAASSHSADEWESYAVKNGSGWHACLGRIYNVERVLFEVIFGTKYAQSPINSVKDANGLYQGGLGAGCTTMAHWDDFGCYPFLPTSAGVDLADACAEKTLNITIKDGTTTPIKVNSFFGLKNWYGHMWKQCIDEVGSKNADASTTHYFLKSLSDKSPLSNQSLTGFTKGVTAPASDGSIIESERGHLENFPTSLGGTTSTYECGYFWHDAGTSGLRLIARGCNAVSAGLCAPAAVSAGSAAAYSVASYGSPLCEVNGDFSVEPVFYS